MLERQTMDDGVGVAVEVFLILWLDEDIRSNEDETC